MQASNGDTDNKFTLSSGEKIVGVGSFHKSLPHNKFGEVVESDFKKLVAATRGNGSGFSKVPAGPERQAGKGVAPLVNPQAGLASDRLTHSPSSYMMPPAPAVLSQSTAAEMLELYWMALLRDLSFDQWINTDADLIAASKEIDSQFDASNKDKKDHGHLQAGVDIPGSAKARIPITSDNIFRLGLPGEEVGPMLSQFFVRPIHFGTQTIDQTQRPYKANRNYLTGFDDWLKAHLITHHSQPA